MFETDAQKIVKWQDEVYWLERELSSLLDELEIIDNKSSIFSNEIPNIYKYIHNKTIELRERIKKIERDIQLLEDRGTIYIDNSDKGIRISDIDKVQLKKLIDYLEKNNNY